MKFLWFTFNCNQEPIAIVITWRETGYTFTARNKLKRKKIGWTAMTCCRPNDPEVGGLLRRFQAVPVID